jgi:hypothetical protein
MIGSYRISELFNFAAKGLIEWLFTDKLGPATLAKRAEQDLDRGGCASELHENRAHRGCAEKSSRTSSIALSIPANIMTNFSLEVFSPNSVYRGLTSIFTAALEATPSKPPKS